MSESKRSGGGFGATLVEVYARSARVYGELPAFARKDKAGVFQSLAFKEIYEQGMDLATALIDWGVQARDHVAVLADNRLEWILSDYGILLAGAADVPRGTDITDAEMLHILTHSDSRTGCLIAC
jgi:long-chain acyl-CoA synthetase